MNKEDYIKNVKERLMDEGFLVFIVKEKNYSGFPDLVSIKNKKMIEDSGEEVKFIYLKMENFAMSRIQRMTFDLISRRVKQCYLLRKFKDKEILYQGIGGELVEVSLDNFFK